MRVAGHAQVSRITNVGAEFEVVVGDDLAPVVHHLKLVLVLDEGAIASGQTIREAVTECYVPAGLPAIADKECRHASSQGIRCVQPQDPDVLRRRTPKAVGVHGYMVFEITESEVGVQR